jgi:hypothetical protein
MIACSTADGPSASRSGSSSIDRRRPFSPARLAPADRDHEVPADEDRDLAGLDHLDVRRRRLRVHVPDGLEHGEQRVLVPVELGPLVLGVQRVLDGQRVQVVALGELGQLRLVRVVQAEPDETVAGEPDLVDDARLTPAGPADAVDVHAAVDQRGGAVPDRDDRRSRRPRQPAGRAQVRSAQVRKHGHGRTPGARRDRRGARPAAGSPVGLEAAVVSRAARRGPDAGRGWYCRGGRCAPRHLLGSGPGRARSAGSDLSRPDDRMYSPQRKFVADTADERFSAAEVRPSG